MATATINGIVFEVSISEMIELANSTARKFAPAPIDNSHAEAIVAEVTKKAEPISSGSFEVTAKCGHTVIRNSPRGRKPNKCAACSGTVESGGDKPEIAAETPETKANSGKRGGYRRFNRSDDGAWKDQPASNNQIERILFGQKRADGTVMVAGLDGRKTTKRNRQRILAEIEIGITGGRASEIWAEVKAMPLI